MNSYIGKIYDQGDWRGKCITQFESEKGLVLGFLRHSSHHDSWSIEFFYENIFLELCYEEVDFFLERLPKNICIVDYFES